MSIFLDDMHSRTGMHSSERGLGHDDLSKNGVGIDCLPEDVIMKEIGEVDRTKGINPLN